MVDYDNSVMSRIIDEKIHNAAHRRVLKMRFIDGETYEQIAEDVKMSPRQIYYIIGKYAPKLDQLLRL